MINKTDLNVSALCMGGCPLGGYGWGKTQKEDLINAKKTPEDYKNLRVRVSGFSDYFVKLNEALQDNIIERTTQK